MKAFYEFIINIHVEHQKYQRKAVLDLQKEKKMSSPIHENVRELKIDFELLFLSI